MQTSTGRKYFFNKKTKQAIWETPDEVQHIVERLDKAAASLDAFDDSDVPEEDEEDGKQQRHSLRLQIQRQQGIQQQQQDAGQTGKGDSTSNAQQQQQEDQEQEMDVTDESSDEDSDEDTNPELEALKSLVRRMEDFKQMLREENFGPFAVYEKVRTPRRAASRAAAGTKAAPCSSSTPNEATPTAVCVPGYCLQCLPRLVYQPRFSAITADQRRRLFDRCIKELAAESRRGQKEVSHAVRGQGFHPMRPHEC